jgi:hypothetical protein
VIGTRPRSAVTGGWRVRSEQATLALVGAVVIGLGAGVYFGMHGRGEVAVNVASARPGPNGIEVVPAAAVVIDPDVRGPVVFVVVNHRAVRQPVVVGPPVPGSPTLNVISGLSAGAQVVVVPPDTLHDGSSVRTSPYGGG